MLRWHISWKEASGLVCVRIDVEYFVFWVALAYSQAPWQHACFNEVFCAEVSACVELMKSLLFVSLHEEVGPTAALSPRDVVSASVIARYCWQG